MPRFAANLSMLYPQHEFLDRFGAARADGFDAVEYLFPYDYPAEVLGQRLRDNGLVQALFNAPPGDWAAGSGVSRPCRGARPSSAVALIAPWNTPPCWATTACMSWPACCPRKTCASDITRCTCKTWPTPARRRPRSASRYCWSRSIRATCRGFSSIARTRPRPSAGKSAQATSRFSSTATTVRSSKAT